MLPRDKLAVQHSKINVNGKILSSEEIVELVLLSINAHYQRNANKVEHMLSELKRMDQQELIAIFKGLRAGSSLDEAIPMLTNWIEAKIDEAII